MDFQNYQKLSRQTAIYPNKGNNFVYPALGLAGESGEVCEKFKKIIRDNGGQINQESKDLIEKELGDVLWYIAAICEEIGLDMDQVAQKNIDKLLSRQARNKLNGSGDNR